MTLTELSKEYLQSAEPLRRRLRELNEALKTEPLCEMERLRLNRRICVLTTMLRDTVATAKYLENYYGRNENEKQE